MEFGGRLLSRAARFGSKERQISLLNNLNVMYNKITASDFFHAYTTARYV